MDKKTFININDITKDMNNIDIYVCMYLTDHSNI